MTWLLKRGTRLKTMWSAMFLRTEGHTGWWEALRLLRNEEFCKVMEIAITAMAWESCLLLLWSDGQIDICVISSSKAAGLVAALVPSTSPQQQICVGGGACTGEENNSQAVAHNTVMSKPMAVTHSHTHIHTHICRDKTLTPPTQTHTWLGSSIKWGRVF